MHKDGRAYWVRTIRPLTHTSNTRRLYMIYYIHSIDQPGLPTFAISCTHRQAYNCTSTVQVQTASTNTTYVKTIARHHQKTVHVSRSSATVTARESKCEDTYMARVTHNKTLYKETSTGT